MSYILEALRKAERERSLGQVPTIDHSADVAEAPRRRYWPWIVVLALLVNAGVLAFWLFRTPGRAPPPVEAASRELPLPSPSEPAVGDYLPPPTTVMDEPIEEAPVAAAPLEPEPGAAAVESIEPEPFAEPEPQALTPEPDIAEAPALEDEGAPPLLRDMPAEFRRSLPAMKMDAHFYTDVPGRSFAMINLRKYKAGERLNEGPQVVEIVPDGVVLEYQGQKFLLTH